MTREAIKQKSEADKMFEELGYKKEDILNIRGANIGTRFRNRKNGYVFSFYDENRVFEKPYKEITMEELKAINKKCEELGWLE